MAGNYMLVAGAAFVLILAIGQLLIERKHSVNRMLGCLFVVSFLWIAHGVAFRVGLVEQLPHLNKVYLPLLCMTGSLWFTYLRSVYNASPDGYSLHYLVAPAVCIVLSIPFYLQSAAYKRAYVEVELVDFASVTMYAATRLAELTLVWYFCKSLMFLRSVSTPQRPMGSVRPVTKERSKSRLNISSLLWYLTIAALAASLLRLVGSVIGSSDTISVLYPSLAAIGVFIVMHFLSYRQPAVLSLSHATRSIQSNPTGAEELALLRETLAAEKWYLEPNLKVQSLARKLGKPVAKVSSLINSVTGMNFNEFINDMRVEHAKLLLVEKPKATITEITHESGFNSKSAFYKHFSAVTGMTPAQYRAGALSKTTKDNHTA